MHEAQLHEHSCFITLTYDDDNLPHDSGLNYRHFQAFMKRLRKWHRTKVRFYMCGEYGERLKRPHYHAALFGCFFPDQVLHHVTQTGSHLFTSAILTKLWPHGLSSIGELNRESAAYIARYVMKKRTGEQAETAYRRTDPITGECFQVLPEFTRMSLKPGIAAKWIEKYHADVYPHDRINSQGRLSRPPRYYDKQMEVLNPDTLVTVAADRYRRAILHSEDNTADRLKTKETIAHAKNKFYKRSLE